MPTLLFVSVGGRLTPSGALDERDEHSLAQASAKIAQIRKDNQSCVVMASDAKLVAASASVVGAHLNVERAPCPHLSAVTKRKTQPEAIVAVSDAVRRYDVTVVVVPKSDLQRMAHAFLKKTVGGGNQLSHGKVVWVDTDHKEHAVL